MATALERSLPLTVILDLQAAGGRDLLATARQAAAGGATLLQVRAKEAPARDLARLVRAVLAAAGAVPVIVNDRLDVALATSAAGCHLGQDDFPLQDARAISPPGFWLGGSAGSPEEAQRAARAGADYLGIGPIFVTGNKPDAGAAIGCEGFRRIHASAPRVLAVGIGGITAETAGSVLAAGAAGVAVIGAVLGAADPLEATRALRAAVDQAAARSHGHRDVR